MANESGNDLCSTSEDIWIYSSVGKRSLVNQTTWAKKLVVDGTYGVNKTHLTIPKIEIFSLHFAASNNTKLQGNDLMRSTNNMPIEFD